MTNQSNKSRTATFVLCFFLGPFGAHRFYAGNTGSAVTMLVLTLTIIGVLVTGIWAFIDFITILVGGFKDGDGLKIKNW